MLGVVSAPRTVPWGEGARVNNWREDTQPEWSVATFGTQELPVTGETAPVGDSGGLGLDDTATRSLPALSGLPGLPGLPGADEAVMSSI